MAKPRVPTSVTVLSILGIIFAILGILGLAVSLFFIFGGVQIGPPNPMMDKINKDTGYRIGIGASLAVGLPLLVLLIASSIGGLSLKSWARGGMLIYAIGTILNGIAGTVFNFAYVIPLMLTAIPENTPARSGAVVGAYGGLCGAVIGLIYPVCVLWFYTRPHVVDAFKGIFPPSRDDNYDYDDRRDRRREGDYREDDRFTDRRG